MTRLSATATIAALLLLAIAQGFGATKVTAKAATKSTAKPYHITAQNQLHFKSARPSKAEDRFQSERNARIQSKHSARTQRTQDGKHSFPAQRMPARTGAVRARRNAANPPTGKIGFVSATQVPAGGGGPADVRMGAFGSSTGFITVVCVAPATPGPCVYNYSVVMSNGDGTFAAPVTTPDPGNEETPYFLVGDVNGDGFDDILQADQSAGTITVNVLLGSATGAFTLVTAGIGAPSPFTIAPAFGATGGTLVMNATTGFLDVVVVDDAFDYNAGKPSNLTTYAGNGDGTFGPAGVVVPVVAKSTTPLAPPATFDGGGYNVIITDFDGDGTVDVAENDYTNGELVVYLSSATTPYTGTAVPESDNIYDACTATSGVLTGTSPAIVDVNCGLGTVSVYNNAAGVFSPGVEYPVVGSAVTPANNVFPVAATIAATTGSGNADVVITNEDSSDVSVLLGNGDGTLQLNTAGTSYATGGNPFGDRVYPAIVTDINGDTLPDILVGDWEYSLTWMAGYGDGTFQAARDFSFSGYSGGYSVVHGDFNGDGQDDVVETSCCYSPVGITVFLSNPDGSLQPGVNYGSGGQLEYAAVADFNGDGNLDIAATGTGGSVAIFFGTGSGTFIEGPSFSSGGSFPQGIVAAAFNGTTAPGTGVAGFSDLAVLNEDSPNVAILVNDGSGFNTAVTYGLTNGGQELATASLSGKNNDLAIAEEGGTNVGVLLGNGDGTFGTETLVPVGGSPYGIALAPIDVDTYPDLVATVDVGGGVTGIAVALNGTTTAGTFGGFTPFAALLPASTQPTFWDSPFPAEIQITDVDGDGVPDLVYGNYDYSTVGVLFGTGTGSVGATPAPYFFDPVEFPAGQETFGVTLANITGDGSPAAVTADDDFAGATTMINGNGSAAAPNYSLSAGGAVLNISDGGTGTAPITLTPVNFYSGTVTFSCAGLALDMTCTFAPASLTPVGNAPVTTTVTVNTKAPHGSLRMPADPHQGRTSLLACLTGMGLFGLLLAGDWKNKRNRRVGILLGILVLGMMFSLVGCSSSTPGTPLGAQTVTIQGTGSDGVANSVGITVNVF
jgi:hypothetical protein